MVGATAIAEHEIAEFWKGHILSELYQKRPRKQDFHSEGVAEATGVCPEEDIDDFFNDVVDWLKEEYLVRVGDELTGQVLSVSLTSRGLGIMAKQEAGWTGAAVDYLSENAKKLPASILNGGVGMAIAALRSYMGL
nr:hypothetical protein [Brevundimonas diminuta]